MTDTIAVAVPRKGRPLEAVLQRVAAEADAEGVADEIISTLRYEKAVTKGNQTPERDAYDRLAEYSHLADPTKPDFTLLRDDRAGKPRRIVFDSVDVPAGDVTLRLVGREEPFRSLRKHDFALGFDSADLVLEEVVELRPDPLTRIADVNARIDPHDTDVRVVAGMGDTVYHTLMATPEILPQGDRPTREFLRDYEGELCISPRYERLVEAVVGTRNSETFDFAYPDEDEEEEAAIADTGAGVYLTVTGSTAREHGLVVGEELFPSETVLMENYEESGEVADRVKELFARAETETAMAIY
ncbi:hypothetical protein M0R88_14965 [Halorussus gelatinilyticus]|uniref:Uncharacterized protein n=1 Tax=Halorussus gelatinilyticus TaxID=2937524 RepID=A0A8U0IFZ5_9EURY|nr:hypothetical protein [Halorussus gelatinilyticus]UPV99807.1 hypothetical protein M0R88_14965 [Halorussus gelatinilyticus]